MGDELTDLSEDLRYRNDMAIRRTKAGERKVELRVWSVECEVCGDWFETTSGKATYCSTACKQTAYRERQK